MSKSNKSDSSYPFAILLVKNCPKDLTGIKEACYEMVCQFDPNEASFCIIELCIYLQKIGASKRVFRKENGMPVRLTSSLLEKALAWADCKDAIILAKNNRKMIAKMPKSIRTVIQRFK